MKTRREIEAELVAEYITPELREKLKSENKEEAIDAFEEMNIKYILADIDSMTLWCLQFCPVGVPDSTQLSES